MLLNSWLRTLTLGRSRTIARRRQVRSGAKSSQLPHLVERLEDRTLLAVFTVTTAADVINANDGQVSLREAIISANQSAGADTIQFASSLNGTTIRPSIRTMPAGAAEDAGLTGDLDITDDLTITGNGYTANGTANTIIDAGPVVDVTSGLGDRVFHIQGHRDTQSPISVTISGLTIRGGIAAQGGGILSNFARLTIDSSRIENNQAVGPAGNVEGGDGQGGGVYFGFIGGQIGIGSGAGLTVIGTTFTNNEARGGNSNGMGGDGQGGAIFNDAGFVEILEASPVLKSGFQSNRALGGHVATASGFSGDGEGGAIYNRSGHVEIWDAVFTLNAAVGGGLQSNSAQGSGTGYGGAIYTRGGFESGGGGVFTLILNESSFTNNQAVGAGTGAGQGGAIYADNDTVTIDGSTFGMNTALGGVVGGSGLGGAIHATSRFPLRTDIRNSMLTGNRALGGTGGQAEGGAIWSSGTTFELVRDEVSGNRAEGGSGLLPGHGYGGGLYVRQDPSTTPISTIRSTTFAENVASGGAASVGIGGEARGGGVYLGENSSTDISNSTFSTNDANGGVGIPINGPAFGGGMYHAGTTVNVINATFTLNTANAGAGGAGEGGGIMGIGAPVTVGNIVIAQNVVVTSFVPPSPDVRGVFLSQGSNFVGVVALGASGFTDPSDQVGTTGTPGNALLGALGFNLPSGPNGLLTRTHLPQTGSPLIDLGKNSLVPPNPDGFAFGLLPAILPPADQRDFQRIVGANVDIGATESSSTPLPFLEDDTDDEAVFQIVYDVVGDGQGPISASLSGRLTFLTRFDGPHEGEANDSDADNLDDVATFLTHTSFLRSGTTSNNEIFNVQQSTTIPSQGQIEETTNSTPGRLDLPPFGTGTAESVADLYIDVDVQQPGAPLRLHNEIPVRLRSIIDFKPAAPGDTFTLINGPIPLLNAVGQTIATITSVEYTPLPLFDFGDAPETRTVEPTALGGYPTTESRNGARHAVLAGGNGLRLGATVDAESNGIPTINADGDDTTAVPDDEDGVIFTSALTAGQPATATVIASGAGRLNGWIDFNGDGDWYDTGEQIATDQLVSAGPNALAFTVPAGALGLATTYSRFRLSSVTGLSFDGFAPDGEVEDYLVSIQAVPRDFGDAPRSYPTAGSQAAFHTIVAGLHLGSGVDAEATGIPTATANGDDTNGSDDEDGVVFLRSLIAGETFAQGANVRVTASQPGFLNAWLDLAGDGIWHTNDQVFFNQALTAGVNDLFIPVPIVGFELASDTYARFRFTSAFVSFPTPEGGAIDGEVEDYAVPIESYDFGDAAISYGEASHVRRGPRLGIRSDAESFNQPSFNATLDDATNLDDEDGVTFRSLVSGFLSQVTVTASAAGVLNAWFDFKSNDGTFVPDGDFLDAGERIGFRRDGEPSTVPFSTDFPVTAGINNLSFMVPTGLSAGTTSARFRITSAADGPVSNPIGRRSDGEVEDYGLTIAVADLPNNNVENRVFTFTVSTPVLRFRDPAIATGYDYVATGQNFKSVQLPFLTQGDNRYTMHLDDGAGGFQTASAATLDAGIEYDFLAGFVDALGNVFAAVPAGLAKFRILGIETAAAVDPANPVGFVTGLSFVAGGGSFTMTGIPAEIYVDNVASPVISGGMAGDFFVTTDQGTIGMLDNGDTVTWQGGGATSDVPGLIFGATAFSSIQAAINRVESNGWSALTQITISNGTFLENLTISGAGTYVQGSGAGSTFLDGNGTGRVIDVTATANATLYRMTIQNGNAGLGTGGGVRNAGTLSIGDSLIRTNSAGALNVAAGGGVLNSGTLSITNSTISGNTTYDGHGAGLANTGTATITNSTISGNLSGVNGGGVFNEAGGVLTIQNSTVTGNIADFNGDTFGDGGGIFALGTETLTSTIVAGNSRAFVSTPSDIVGGTINTTSRNLIGDAGTAGGIVNGTGGNIVGNAGTGTIPIATILNTTLTDNGGPTPTHALAAASPAIDAGINALGGNSDQRGSESARTTDHTGVVNAAGSDGTDIGAFEISPLTFNITGIGSDFSIRLNSTNGQIEVVDNTGPTIVAYTPFAGTFGLIINGSSGDDALTINFSNGNPIPAGGITFAAGGQTTAAGDSLTITGGTGFSTATYNSTPGGAGTLTLNGSTINFTGLEPVTIQPTAATVTITVNDANGTAGEALATQITNGGNAVDGNLFLDVPGTMEDLTFVMPTNALVLNGDADDNDTILIQSLDTGFAATLSLNGQGGDDTFNFSPGVLLLGSAGTIDGGSGTNTLDYAAYNTPISANLGTGADLTATLNGAQEVPANASAATGTATVTYNLAAQTFNLDLFVQGIVRTNITGFHLHQAAVGVNGAIIVSNLLTLGTFNDVAGGIRYAVNNIPLPAGQQDNFLNGLTYFNIHTNAFGTGEIRGQVLLQAFTGTATGTTAIRNIQNVVGGSVGDTLTGSPANNSLTGGAGDDTLTDTLGTNQLIGGTGCDTINSQPQQDAINDSPPATLEDTAFSFDPRSNDVGTGLTITGATQGTKGGTSFNGTSVTYTPNADANGSDSFSYTITDFENCMDTATVNVSITAVNDVPSFSLAGNPATVDEDAGARTVGSFASNIRRGPVTAGDESTQTLTFNLNVQGTTGSLTFSTAPAIDSATGQLTYTATGNTSGTATVQVTLSDNGGGTAPNVNTSASQSFTITVNSVNDVPSFTKGGNQTVVDSTGAQTVSGWATNISRGPADEAGQTLTFLVTNDNNALFSAQPAVASNGTLAYTSAANATGMATVTVQLMDNGTTANNGVDTSAAQTFTITVEVAQSRFRRMYNRGRDAHFFTTSLAEFQAVQNSGYADEVTGLAGFNVAINNASGSTAIHRLYNLAPVGGGQHYYTRNSAERDALVGLGWRFEGTAGFLFPNQAAGTVEILHLYNGNSGGHLFTESTSTRDAVLTLPGWQLQTSLGFAFAALPGSAARRAMAVTESAVEEVGSQRFEAGRLNLRASGPTDDVGRSINSDGLASRLQLESAVRETLPPPRVAPLLERGLPRLAAMFVSNEPTQALAPTVVDRFWSEFGSEFLRDAFEMWGQ